MTDFIVIAILLLIVGAAIFYIRKEKERGATCIGCPHAGECAKKRQGGCDSHTGTN
ncbi:MAG: FeoB-associated Cys-rich membrane protein [Lachnospiraceae bacterium]|nr:FeoB-associated Cys-rich membrane protein [Lachnospiraceae bacterium]